MLILALDTQKLQLLKLREIAEIIQMKKQLKLKFMLLQKVKLQKKKKQKIKKKIMLNQNLIIDLEGINIEQIKLMRIYPKKKKKRKKRILKLNQEKERLYKLLLTLIQEN